MTLKVLDGGKNKTQLLDSYNSVYVGDGCIFHPQIYFFEKFEKKKINPNSY